MRYENNYLSNNGRMSTSAGSAVDGSTARYTPFGDWRTEPTATLTDRGYTGHLHNNLGSGSDDLGLIYMNARYYLPSAGRFISPDTIVPNPANPQSYNRYSYVYNNPILYIDPSGHCGTITVEYNENGDTTTGRDLSDSQCWQQYDDLYNQLLANNVLHIEEIIGTGADYQYHEGFDTYQRSIVTLMDHYLRCGGVCENGFPSSDDNFTVSCNYWESCWEIRHQTTHTEWNFFWKAEESDKGQGAIVENPPFVLCLGVCIAGGNKKYYSADGELATHSQIGFGIGIGAEFNDYGLGGYFIIQDITVTNSNGEQFSGQGGAFSFTVPFVNFESSTTVNFNE